MRCPLCEAISWKGGRAVAQSLCVILLFPIGLVLLIIPPTWVCRKCGYRYASHAKPMGWRPTVAQELGRAVTILIVLGLLGAGVYFGGLQYQQYRAEEAARTKRATRERENAPIVDRNAKRQSDVLTDTELSPVR